MGRLDGTVGDRPQSRRLTANGYEVLMNSNSEPKTRNSKPLQVFQVVPAAAWGGGSVVILRLVKKLIQVGCQVTVLCSTDARTVTEFSKSGAEVIHARHWRRPVSPVQDVLLLYELYTICRQRRFDVVHTHNPKGGVVGRIAAGLAGTPLVIHTIHGLTFNDFMPPWRVWLYRTLERVAARFCDVLISVNEEDRQRAIEAGIAEPDHIATVLNGIDVDQFINATPAPLRTELSLPDETILIGATGRLAVQKGYEYLIRAIPLLVAAEPRAHVLLAGTGELDDDLRALVSELGVEEFCHFLGFREDIPALLASFDFYAQPSLWEGLSISLLEAMAAGKPIVTTDIIGNREVVEDGVLALLVPPADVEALATAILELTRDPARAQRLGSQARQHVVRYFSADRMVKETLHLYRRQLARTAIGEAYMALEI